MAGRIRRGNLKLKAKRARSWARGQERKADRIEKQDARAEANRVRRANGEPTPWEAAKLKARGAKTNAS